MLFYAGDGYVRSETIMAIYLQKKESAKRIYATVVHSKSNSDGYKDQGSINYLFINLSPFCFPFIAWYVEMCSNFLQNDKIYTLCRAVTSIFFSFELAHIGWNTTDDIILDFAKRLLGTPTVTGHFGLRTLRTIDISVPNTCVWPNAEVPNDTLVAWTLWPMTAIIIG